MKDIATAGAMQNIVNLFELNSYKNSKIYRLSIMLSSAQNFIHQQILRYRDLLADMSRKNKELYYKESRGYSINLSKPPRLDETSKDTLLGHFLPLKAESPLLQKLLNEQQIDLSKHFLLDETKNEELIKKLDKIRLANIRFQQEYGIPGAWLLGPFLCWRDTSDYQDDNLLISPIFKIPVEIKKDKRKRWFLELKEGDELQLNPSLRLALRQKWGIKLPEQLKSNQILEALEEIKSYIEEAGKTLKIEEALTDSIPKLPPRYKNIKDESGEIIERIPTEIKDTLSKKDYDFYQKVTHTQFFIIDVLVVDHLNTSRTVLLQDYDAILEQTEMHPVLSELFLGKPIPRDTENYNDQIKDLDSYKERENYFVVNIDSSQHRAINQTTKNQVVIIQGPPGTGKSQTITNLIADSLAKGKKVLFVSEKRAALDVVCSRLKQANLSSQTVLIHSSDLKKQQLYQSFLELSGSVHDSETDNEWNLITDELDKSKSEIKSYYQILEKKHIGSGLSISELFTLHAQYNLGCINPNLAKMFSACTYAEFKNIVPILDQIQNLIIKIPNFSTHPWMYKKNSIFFTASLSQSVSALVRKIQSSQDRVNELKNSLLDLGINILEETIGSDVLDSLLTFQFNNEWEHFYNAFYKSKAYLISSYQKEIENIVEIIRNNKQSFDSISNNANIDIVLQLESYYSQNRGFFDYFTFKFWKMRHYRSHYLSEWDGTNTVFKSYRLIHEAINTFKSIPQNKVIPLIIESLNPHSVLEIYKRVNPIIEDINNINILSTKIGFLNHPRFENLTPGTWNEIKSVCSKIAHLKSELKESTDAYQQYKGELLQYFDSTPTWEDSTNSFNYQTLIQTMDDLPALDQISLHLEDLSSHLRINFSKQMIAVELVPINTPWGSYALSLAIQWWVDEVLSEYPILRSFDNDVFQKKIENFIEVEEKHRYLARDFVNNTFSKRWNKGLGEFTGLTLLKKEAGKQRKVLPPREIMERGALSTMIKLKPCWLMSPLSISQILPLKMGLFDIIIFDEASQVRVEDAIPSIYRANSLVVVGDPKQMPPTNFFSISESIEDDENTEEELAASILDLASHIYPSEMLEWHYRSRSEALISFSNKAFYGGRLIAAPNPHLTTETAAIKFHQINDAYFTYKHGNLLEAEAIVERLSELLRTEQKKSIGIITMGQAQMIAIDEAIERKQLTDTIFKDNIDRARNYYDGEADASFFVKNLEHVQGDERDIILISVGYAPSTPNKKLHLNFGPLSKQGGSRRLNVAITRAKEQIEVFCSFRPDQIPTEEEDFGKNTDLVMFGRYLKYVKAVSEKKHIEAKSILDSFGVSGVITTRKSSSFSKDVHRRLEELGYKVSAEIGSNGFYIDLGVHHPVIPTNFILGIECDGAIFHSTPYARDRDKIRQELLESRGWKIERIWSQNWSKDWKAEINKIDSILKKLIN